MTGVVVGWAIVRIGNVTGVTGISGVTVVPDMMGNFLSFSYDYANVQTLFPPSS